MEQQAGEPVRDLVDAPAAVPEAAPGLAPPALDGFAGAIGNRAFGAYVARVPRGVPAGRTLARDKEPKPDPAAVTATERQDELAQALIGLPLATAAGNLDKGNPGKPLLESVRRRVSAARGAFRSFHFPLQSVPGQRMQDAQARVDISLALLDAMLSKHPDRLLRAHWQKSLALCGSLSRHLPKPTPAEPEDKRALMRDSVAPSVAAAIADIPAIVGAESGDAMLQLVGNHDTIPDAIAQVAGQQGLPAALEFKQGIELVKLHARPEEERAKFISLHLERAMQDLLRLNDDMGNDTDLVEPGDPPPPDAPAATPGPPDPAPSPNALPPPPPPPGAAKDAGAPPPVPAAP